MLVSAVAALVLLPAGAASAHVHVEPGSTAANGTTEVSFRVPTESETTSTTKLQVALPSGTPFTTVAVQSLPGWTSKVTTGKLPSPVTVGGATLTEAPTAVTWTPSHGGTGVGPEEYQYFTLTVGPLPKAGTRLMFPATQTYSDGKVVKWDQVTPSGGAEPEHPTPEFTTTAALPGAGGDDDGDGDDNHAATSATPTPETTRASGDGEDGTARWMGGAGLAFGVLALGVAGAGTLRGKRHRAGGSEGQDAG